MSTRFCGIARPNAVSAGDRLASLTERPPFPMVSTYVPRRSSAGGERVGRSRPGRPARAPVRRRRRRCRCCVAGPPDPSGPVRWPTPGAGCRCGDRGGGHPIVRRGRAWLVGLPGDGWTSVQGRCANGRREEASGQWWGRVDACCGRPCCPGAGRIPNRGAPAARSASSPCRSRLLPAPAPCRSSSTFPHTARSGRRSPPVRASGWSTARREAYVNGLGQGTGPGAATRPQGTGAGPAVRACGRTPTGCRPARRSARAAARVRAGG